MITSLRAGKGAKHENQLYTVRDLGIDGAHLGCGILAFYRVSQLKPYVLMLLDQRY